MSQLSVIHISSIEKESHFFNNLFSFSTGNVNHGSITLGLPDCDFVKSLAERSGFSVGLGTPNRASYPNALVKIRKILKERRPSIVNVHLFEPSLLGALVVKSVGAKLVMTRHHSDAIHKLSPSSKRNFYLRLERFLNRRADHIIAPSTTVRDILVEREGVEVEKVSLIPYGQTSERFDSLDRSRVAATRKELGFRNDTLNIICNSRLYVEKGHEFLFRAAKRLKELGFKFNMFLLGEGPQEVELRELAKELGIGEDVKFLGWRPDVLEIMSNADILVHPSLEDALSQALIEAIMLQIPVIATDISGARDTLGGGKYGKLVQPRSEEDLVEAITSVWADLDEAKARASSGRSFLLDYMGAKRVADMYESVYRSVVGQV